MELTNTTPPTEIANYILANPPPGWLEPSGSTFRNVQEGYRMACTRWLEQVKWDGNGGGIGGEQKKGIVICAGGNTYFPCVWVLLNLLRKKHGCTLPIELWHIGAKEIDSEMSQLLQPFNVVIRDAEAVAKYEPIRIMNGWELKSYAIKHSIFDEVLYIDADNVPTRNPEFLFDTPQYQETGAIMWGDYNYLSPQACLIFGVQFTRVKERETGQLVINKKKCWKELMLANWYSEHSDYYYKHVYGDKECFHMAWRRLDSPVADPPEMVGADGVMNQHDFEGKILFHHRNRQKWVINVPNNKIMYEGDEWCVQKLKELALQWSRTQSIAPDYFNELRAEHKIVEELKKTRVRATTGGATSVTGPGDCTLGVSHLIPQKFKLDQTTLIAIREEALEQGKKTEQQLLQTAYHQLAVIADYILHTT